MPITVLNFTPTSAASFRVDALEYVAESKKALHKLLPDVKSSHLAEAIAASLGFKTHAAMLAQLEGKSMMECPEFDEPRFAARLVELGYPNQVTALADAHGRLRSGATSMVAGEQKGWVSVDQAAEFIRIERAPRRFEWNSPLR